MQAQVLDDGQPDLIFFVPLSVRSASVRFGTWGRDNAQFAAVLITGVVLANKKIVILISK